MIKIKSYQDAGNLTRWHSVRTYREQTLAEHNFLVAAYSKEIAALAYKNKLSCEGKLMLLEYGLIHDVAEIITKSDISSPMKARIDAVCKQQGCVNPIDIVEAEVAPEVEELKKQMKEYDPALLIIAKLAER